MDASTDSGAAGSDGTDGGDLKGLIEQLQATAEQFKAQVQAVASAAGVSTGGEAGPGAGEAPAGGEAAPPEETPPEAPAGGGNASMAAFMAKPKMRM